MILFELGICLLKAYKVNDTVFCKRISKLSFNNFSAIFSNKKLT